MNQDFLSWLEQRVKSLSLGPQGLNIPLPPITVGQVADQYSQASKQFYQNQVKTGELMTKANPTPEEKQFAQEQIANIVSPAGIQTVNKAAPVVKAVAAPAFEGLQELTTSIIQKLRGTTAVAPETITNLTKQQGVKQAEKDVLQKVLAKYQGKIPTQQFAKDVESELLPLKRGEVTPKWENVSLEENRGNVANYSEHVYQSPIKTSAGSRHYSGYYRPTEAEINAGIDTSSPPNYFAHTRVEDLGDNQTRRVIEAQSDLFQKGRLEQEGQQANEILNNPMYAESAEKDFKTPGVRQLIVSEAQKRANEINKLKPYENTWHERVIREEVKKAAQDGKTKLQFPTGETAMKIEGLGSGNFLFFQVNEAGNTIPRNILSHDLKIGKIIGQGAGGPQWVITEVLGDGKFKAIPKSKFEESPKLTPEELIEARREFDQTPINDRIHQKFEDLVKATEARRQDILDHSSETFDISGKADTNNPIYKFYESEVGKYLKNKYGATRITDSQGVDWWQLDVKPEHGRAPVEAFGIAGIAGGSAMLNQDREEKLNQRLPSIR